MSLTSHVLPGQEALWFTCPVPACRNPVGDPRDVCPECRAAFGALIRPAGSGISARDFAAAVQKSDERVRMVLRERRNCLELEGS